MSSSSSQTRRRSSSNEHLSSDSGGAFGLNFDFPRINIQSFTQPFSNRSFTPPSSLSDFMPFRPQSRSSSSSSRDQRSMESNSCEGCGTRFSFLKRRKNCQECQADYCTVCFVKDNPILEGSTRRGLCRRCRVLNMQPLDRLALMTLRVKDLRWYLASKRVSAHLCKEKSDLVDLILTHNGYVTSGASTSYHRSRPESRRNSNVSRVADPTSTDTSSPDDNSWILLGEEEGERQSNQAPEDVPGARAVPDDPSIVDSPSRLHEDYKPFNIDDLENELDVQQLSVRQMKLVLTRNFVDYKGCCEKEELLDKTLRLWREKRITKAQDPDDISDENCCKICMEAVIDCVLLECGHMISCTNCGKRLSECPICRQYVVRAVRIFKS